MSSAQLTKQPGWPQGNLRKEEQLGLQSSPYLIARNFHSPCPARRGHGTHSTF
jgi:hypothetical protein